MAPKGFSLCTKCATRQGVPHQFRIVSPNLCFICGGLSAKVPAIERRAAALTKSYEFRTFSIGMIVPAKVQEREDELRSELQIRGGDTFKFQISREIASSVSKALHRRIDRGHPEIIILADLKTNRFSVSSKALFVHGRYTKPSKVSQRQELCEKCRGRGCEECISGYSKSPSIERALGRKLIRITKGLDVTFTWLGSEDTDSVVYPPGRPFVAEVRNPRRRHVPKTASLATGRGIAHVLRMKVLKGRPKTLPSFIFKTRAFIEPLQGSPADLGPASSMKGATVEYRNNKGKSVLRKVYSIHVERNGRLLVADVKLDGGLPVKRLVSGESTSPSLAEVLKTPLKCQRFDILRVWESGSFEFGKV